MFCEIIQLIVNQIYILSHICQGTDLREFKLYGHIRTLGPRCGSLVISHQSLKDNQGLHYVVLKLIDYFMMVIFSFFVMGFSSY